MVRVPGLRAVRVCAVRIDAIAGADFFFGAMSPYSWFAAERIDALIPQARWRPTLGGVIFGATQRVPWSMNDDTREPGKRECGALARSRGLGEMRWPDPWPASDLAAARAITWAADIGREREAALAIMRAAFLQGADISEPATVLAAVGAAGLDAEAAERAMGEPELKDRLRASVDEGVRLGLYGIPTVAVGGELFWGDDRLEEAAAAAAAA